MKHYLTYKDEKSDKFWQIEVNGSSFTVTYGKTGTAGTSQTKVFDSDEKCLKEAEKLVAEKKKKGYLDIKKDSKAGQSSKPDYSKILSAKSKKEIHLALSEHFSYLVDTPGFEHVLPTLMSEVTDVKMRKETLLVKFKGKTVLVAEPPLKTTAYKGYPESFQKLMANHSSLSIDYPVNCSLYPSDSYMDDRWECEELEEYDDVKTAINIESDLYIYHPDEKNAFGESALYFLDHEDASLGAFEDMNAGSLFLIKLCEILKIEVDIPTIKRPTKTEIPIATDKPQEINEVWWNSLEPIWKIVFALNFSKEKGTIKIKNSFDLKRVWNDLKPKIDAIDEPWKKVASLIALKCTLTNDGSICEFQVKDLTPLSNLTQLKKLDLGSSKIRSLLPIQYLNHLEYLYLSSDTLKDLEGIENLHSLTELNISAAPAIKDLSLIYALKNLKILAVNNLKIDSLNGIEKLKSLRKLNCSWCNLKSIDGLNVGDLEELELGGLKIKDVEAFKSLSQLRSLIIEGTEIKNTEGFKYLSKLKHLKLDKIKVDSIGFLLALTGVEKLEIRWIETKKPLKTLPLQHCVSVKELSISQDINAMEGIEHLKGLEVLDISRTDMTDLQFLNDHTSLKVLNCNKNITDLSPLRNCINLESLDLSSTEINSLAGLSDLKNLKSIRCSSQVSDLTPLKNCLDLESVSVKHSDFDDIEFLGQFKKLKYLVVHKTKIKTLEPLKNCPLLETIYCNETAITNLAPLSKCKNLEYLNTSDTMISSIEPLRNCTELETLIISNTLVDDLEPISNCKRLSSIQFEKTTIKSLDALKNCKSLELNPYGLNEHITKEMLKEFNLKLEE
jgi:Leucine-rich repeat (LRR) protein/predicted DNA-binding WGR domain protein